MLFHGSAYEYVKKIGFNGAVITSLYRLNFLKKNNILFEKFSYREDLLFNIRCYTLSNITIKYTSLVIYGYFVRTDSASRLLTKERLIRAIHDFSGIIQVLESEIIPKSSQLSDILRSWKISLQNEAFLKLFCNPNLTLRELKLLLREESMKVLFPIKSKRKFDILKNYLIRNPILFRYLAKLYKSFKKK